MAAAIDPALIAGLAAWVTARQHGYGVLTEVTIDRPCPLCDGTRFCPAGCPMGACALDYSLRPWRRQQPVRLYELTRTPGGGWDEVLVSGREWEACTVYGECLSCFPDGLERRRAMKDGSVYLIDGVPRYSMSGYDLIDPIRVSKARVEREISRAAEPQQMALIGGESQ